MRIHTDVTRLQIEAACRFAQVRIERLTEHKSNTHRGAFELNLSGSSPRRTQRGDSYAATWDEWGIVLAEIFARDPQARMGGSQKRPVYAHKADFDEQTDWRFEEDTYPADFVRGHAHRWEFDGASTAHQRSDFVCKTATCNAGFRRQW